MHKNTLYMILYHSQLCSIVRSLTYILHENRKIKLLMPSLLIVLCHVHTTQPVFFPDCSVSSSEWSVSSSEWSVSSSEWSVSFPTSEEVGGRGEHTRSNFDYASKKRGWRREDWILIGPRSSSFRVPRNLSHRMIWQARDTVLVMRWDMTGWTQTLPWWLGGRRGEDDRKQNAFAPMG